MGKKKNRIEKQYITKQTIHLGTLKRTIKKGTILFYVNENQKQSLTLGDQTVYDLRDFKICLKNSLIEQCDKSIPIDPEQEIRQEKMPIYISNEDSKKQLDNTKETKEIKVEDKTQQETEKIRGFKVIKQQEQIIQEQGISMKVSSVNEKSEKIQVLKDINTEEKIIGKVSEITKKRETNQKKNAEQTAKKRAMKRKKQSETNQKKMKKEGKKK